MPHDDLGHPYDGPRPATRVVSLVPSITEALVSVRRSAVVGATDWCTHPADLDVTRVRGTKNPDLAAIRALSPDLVVANKEENRELDVRRLREAGVPVWVTDIETVPQAIASLERLFDDGARLGAAGLAGRGPRALVRSAAAGHPSAWRSRSGATRGWWSAARRSPATWPAGWGWRTSTRRTPSATPTSSSPTWTRPARTSCCCPTSPTSSPARRRPRGVHPDPHRAGERPAADVVRPVAGRGALAALARG